MTVHANNRTAAREALDASGVSGAIVSAEQVGDALIVTTEQTTSAFAYHAYAFQAGPRGWAMVYEAQSHDPDALERMAANARASLTPMS